MAPVIPCSAGNVTIAARSTFSMKNETRLTKCRVTGKSIKPTLLPQRFLLPHSISLSLLHKYKKGSVSKHDSSIQILAAVGTDVATEEPNPVVSGEDADRTSDATLESTGTNETSSAGSSTVIPTAQSKRLRPVRKSEMPPVKNEELVPGASFTGKVRSIQPFGAFVDFGAFTDGLVHVSRLSDEFVKDVANVVSVGQIVNMRIVEANMETGRISLTMRESDDINKLQQRKEAPSGESSNKPRTVRKNAARPNQKRDEIQKGSKFVKGQVLDGTVKNLTRSGAFVSLPEGEEGFLPLSEQSEGFGNILGSSSLQVGQEVNVRVLRITRGQVTLTMKKEEDVEGLNMKLNQGVVHVATNPFELAFRKNKDIGAFLHERERAQESVESSGVLKTLEQIDEKVIKTVESDAVEVEYSTESSNEEMVSIPSSSKKGIEDDRTSTEELPEGIFNTSISEETVSSTDSLINKASVIDEVKESKAVTRTTEEDDTSPETLILEESGSAVNFAVDEASKTDEEKESGFAAKIRQEELQSETLVLEANGSSASLGMDDTSVMDGLKEADTAIKTTEENEVVSISESSAIDEASITVESKEYDVTIGAVQESGTSSKTLISEQNGSAADSVTDEIDGLKGASSETDHTGQISMVPEEVLKSHYEDGLVNDEVDSKAPLFVDNEMASAASKDVKLVAPSDPEKNGNATSSVQNCIPTQESSTKATISPALVKQLREETGAGMMDCKKALAETEGDIVKAQEFLRKKGLASADKKASRATAEGRIGSYIHDNRIGVLIEVNCETDFVSRGEIFKQLVDDLAMQVAACPQVRYLVTEDVPEEIVNKEREIEMQKEDLLTKPEQIRSKIVEGRIRKRLEEFALLEQPYIKNDKMVIKDWVKHTIAAIGENIKVGRFVRYNLGEGLEKKSQDFAAEVASAAKPSPAVAKDQSVEAKEPVEKSPTVTVSAALVKQLREETGAGMMDCKKALTETGGNLEKAQEHLRKKGLSSADKKSSRLAAEGRISSYIHDSRIGVLIEVNCETDFVGRNERFKELVDDLAMQVVACPQVEFVSVEDIPERIVSKEREIEMQREDLNSKPENIREKIVEGRISKRLGELALSEQPFIKDDSVLVKDLVKQTVAALGENIRVRRFVRFTLGENKDQV